MSNTRNRKALAGVAALAASALLLTLFIAGRAYARNTVIKTITFAMPPCPIKAFTTPPTKSNFTIPRRPPLIRPLSVTGTIQMTDQTSSTVLLLQPTLSADHTGLSFSRTVKQLGHATGELTFDMGCTKTDPYGSNNCQWPWGESITEDFSDTLQENISAGKLIVDLQVSTTSLTNPAKTTTTPLQFTCSICGSPCSFSVPKELDSGHWNRVWDLMISILRHDYDVG